MSNNDQQLVDHLYNTIFDQQLRCNHFDSVCKQPTKSVWNKHADEKKILDIFVEKYKKFYKDKVLALKPKIQETKETNINSYLTYDKEYYISQYNQRIEEIDKYLVELEAKTFDHIVKDNLSSVSVALDLLIPNYLVTPTLLGKLYDYVSN
jgi:hypothetical protein